jgi:acylphosphatase
MKTLAITISGRVQGVWFRASAKRIADDLHIKGFIRNEPDGSVFILAQGSGKKLKQFTDWCVKGPPLALVDTLNVNETESEPLTEFTIKR